MPRQTRGRNEPANSHAEGKIRRLQAQLVEYFPALERAFDYSRSKAALLMLTKHRTPDGGPPSWPPASPLASCRTQSARDQNTRGPMTSATNVQQERFDSFSVRIRSLEEYRCTC